MSELLPVSFGSLLRSLRTAAGLTQEELTEAARVSYRSISDLERGVSRFPRRDTARLLADALGLSADDRARFEAAARGHPPATGNVVYWPLPGGIAAATRTLPRDVASLAGREPEIESILMAVTGAGGVVDICAIDGMAGVGLGQANALVHLGRWPWTTDDYQGEVQAPEQALHIYHGLGIRAGEASALNERGTLCRIRSELTQAEGCHLQALELARAISSSWDEAHALADLGRCTMASGHATQA